MLNSMKAANLLVQAATDAQFRARFMADPVATAAAAGVSLHDHESYGILQDEAGLRHIVVTEAAHGQASSGDLPSEPTIADLRRWATFHVHAGDDIGAAIGTDMDAAIAAAGAKSPGGLSFKVAIDDAKTMHMVIPFAASSEVSMDEANNFVGAGTESVATDTTVAQTAEVETTEVAQAETTVEVAAEVAVGAVEVETTFSTTTMVAEVEVAIVPGFIT